jgi:hypothetical protein
MAGRPKRRLAAAAAAQPPAPDFAAEVMRLMTGSADDALMLPPPAETRADIAQVIQREDRQSLAVWWREQIQTLEEEHQERTAALAGAGEHPSPIYAAQVRKFGAIGMPPDVIAVLLGISEGALGQYYESDVRVGEGLFMMPVAQNMFRIATSGNDRVAVKAGMEILNRRGGEPWKPPAQKLEIDDARSKKQRVIDSSTLTWEQRQQLRAIIEQHSEQRVIEAPQASGLAGGQDSDIVEE